MAVKKKIDIEVNASSLEKAAKKISSVDSSLKAIAKSEKKILELLSVSVVKEKALANAKKKTTEALRDQVKEYERLKKISDFSLQQEKRRLEQPKKGLLQSFQERPRGLKGLVDVRSQKVAQEGDERVAAFDEKLVEQRAKRDDLLAAFKAAQAKGEGVESARAALEGQDEKIARTELRKSKAIGENKTELAKLQGLGKVAGGIDSAFKKLGRSAMNLATKPFKDLKEAVVSNVSAMLDFKNGVATFSTASSLITNSAAREQQLKYGLSASQNYAFTQAKEMLGIQGDEDLMYMNAAQRERFLSYMQRYSTWYDELEASGVLASIQEMQLEFKEFKQELAMEFLQWVAQNKDTIMACLRGIFEFIKAIASAVMSIVTFFTGKQPDLYSPDSASDRVSSYSNQSKISNITMNINTTNNATGVLSSQEEFDRFSEENWSKLAKEVVGAIGG